MSQMRNAAWDFHVYGWVINFNPDQAVCDKWLADSIQTISVGNNNPSLDGNMPVVMGEFGTSTNGSTPDANGTQIVVSAFHAACSGGTAWQWKAGASDLLQLNGVLTSFGKVVAQWQEATRRRPGLKRRKLIT